MMQPTELNVVTGAFGYTGKYITRQLLSMGKEVRTLTGHANNNQFGARVPAFPFNFENPPELVKSLRGATALYNTYWIRFPRGKLTYHRAVENTRTLIEAAKEAGIRKFVHISITNASKDSPLPYFRGKGIIENALMNSGLSYAIIRPTVIFGTEDILINNIAWLLRKSPVFAVIGSGAFLLRPVFVNDVASMAVDAGYGDHNMIVDAVGPEIFTFAEMVRLIADTVQSRARIVHVSPQLAYLLSRLIGYVTKDVLLTRDEIKGLTSNLLATAGPPTGETLLSEWLKGNAGRVGLKYASELNRHY